MPAVVLNLSQQLLLATAVCVRRRYIGRYGHAARRYQWKWDDAAEEGRAQNAERGRNLCTSFGPRGSSVSLRRHVSGLFIPPRHVFGFFYWVPRSFKRTVEGTILCRSFRFLIERAWKEIKMHVFRLPLGDLFMV